METATKTETYTEIKKRHHDEFNAFPVAFAFNEEQLKEALVKLGAEQKECCTIGGGGIIKKTDSAALNSLLKQHGSEMASFYENDASLIDAIVYELGNHEYCITYDPTDTIEALGLDMKQERVQDCFEQARKQYWAANEDN